MSDSDDLLFIWICRWDEFQHYRPERDRPPAWIKTYTKQMHDARYLELPDRARALLHDLRHVFAVTAGQLSRDTRVVSQHRHRQTFRADLERLNHAGFIDFISRETLDQRLEELYSPPRARVEVEVEVEDKNPPTPRRRGGTQSSKQTTPKPEPRIHICPHCQLPFKAQTQLGEHLYHSHDGPEPAHWIDAATRTSDQPVAHE